MTNKDEKPTFEDRFYKGEEINQIIAERMSNVENEQAKIIKDLRSEVVEQRRQRAMNALQELDLDEGFAQMMDFQTEDGYQKSLEILQRQANRKSKKKSDSKEDVFRKIMGLRG